MRRAPSLTLGLATLALAAGGLVDAVQARTQAAASPPPTPPQYLRWAGRPDVSAMPVAETTPQPASRQRRSNRVIPHGGAQAVEAPPPTAPRRTLTPATAWLRPPVSMPPPVAPPPAIAPVRAPAPVSAAPAYLPEQGGRGQTVPAEVALPTPAPVADAAPADPMAPRRDAPIFRIQQTPPPAASAVQPVPSAAPSPQQPVASAAETAPPPRPALVATANPDDRPVEQGARYYSVHRQTGRQPDPVAIPEPTYVDALAITTPVTLASQDLAQPDPGPTLIRDAQGRTRVQPATPEGDYQ